MEVGVGGGFEERFGYCCVFGVGMLRWWNRCCRLRCI